MKTADEIVEEIDSSIAHHERELTKLRQMRAGFTTAPSQPPLQSAPPAPAKANRRRRRTKAEMEDIYVRIEQIRQESPSASATDVWRQMIKDGFMENASSDRDTVSKRIRLMDELAADADEVDCEALEVLDGPYDTIKEMEL